MLALSLFLTVQVVFISSSFAGPHGLLGFGCLESRGAKHVEVLFTEMGKATISVVATDHSSNADFSEESVGAKIEAFRFQEKDGSITESFIALKVEDRHVVTIDYAPFKRNSRVRSTLPSFHFPKAQKMECWPIVDRDYHPSMSGGN